MQAAPCIAALARLLANTGLQFEFINDRTVEIFAHPPVAATGKVVANSSFDNSGALEEVLVTATKREEPLSSVPMSISVLTADELDAKGARGPVKLRH